MGSLVIALVILGGGLIGLVIMWLNEKLEDHRWSKSVMTVPIEELMKGDDSDPSEFE